MKRLVIALVASAAFSMYAAAQFGDADGPDNSFEATCYPAKEAPNEVADDVRTVRGSSADMDAWLCIEA